MTHSYVTSFIHTWNDWFIYGIGSCVFVALANWLCDMTHSYVTSFLHMWHDWFMYSVSPYVLVTPSHWLGDMTHSYVMSLIQMWHDWFIYSVSSCVLVTFAHSLGDMTHSYLASLIHTWMTDSYTARSREDKFRNGHCNAKQDYRWSPQVSFQTAHVKRDLNFDHRGSQFTFGRGFRGTFFSETSSMALALVSSSLLQIGCVIWRIHTWRLSFICDMTDSFMASALVSSLLLQLVVWCDAFIYNVTDLHISRLIHT